MMLVGMLIGYFIGLISCLIQVIRMENKYSMKIQDILERKDYIGGYKTKEGIYLPKISKKYIERNITKRLKRY